MALPMPDPAPVMMAVLFLNLSQLDMMSRKFPEY